MKTKSNRKPFAARFRQSSSPSPSPDGLLDSSSPPRIVFNLGTPSKSKKKPDTSHSTTQFHHASSPSLPTTPTTLHDLHHYASSTIQFLKHNLDHFHSEFTKDVEASASRLHKRFKIQNQKCELMTGEVEKEYRKMAERFHENQESLKASYAEILGETQSSASRGEGVVIRDADRSLVESRSERFSIVHEAEALALLKALSWAFEGGL